jgi:hypothetical protein
MSASGADIEDPVPVLGSGGAAVGVVTHAARVSETVVLIVPASGDARTGPGRLYVRLARELARRGLPSLRFDASDGGDSPPAMAADPRYDEAAVAAARQLLGLYPDAFVAVLAVGRGAVHATHSWHALARANLPLSALCLIDPDIALPSLERAPNWRRRLFGARSVESAAAPAESIDGGNARVEASESAIWYSLPEAVRAARSRLLIAARNDSPSNPALLSLANERRDWRKALRRSRGLLRIDGADAAFTRPEAWRTLSEWLGARLPA